MNVITLISKIKYDRLSNLFSIFNVQRYAVIKGEALSKQAYYNNGMRISGDIDLLISRSCLTSFESVLTDKGFTNTNKSRSDRIMMLSSSHQVAPWIKDITPWGKIEIDLNLDLFWGEYTGKRINNDTFLSDTVEMDIYGCKVKTLPPIKALIQLILHHYKDLNSIFLIATRPTIKQDMFKDVYHLLKNNLAEIPLDMLYDMCDEYEIIPYVYYVLYHTGLLYNDKIFQQYIDAFNTPEGKALLNCYGLNDSERREWKSDFQTRLESNNLYSLIESDLTDKDREKIAINRRVFLGE